MGKKHEYIVDYDPNYGNESDALIAAAQQRRAAEPMTPDAQRLAAEAAAEAQRDAEAQQKAATWCRFGVRW